MYYNDVIIAMPTYRNKFELKTYDLRAFLKPIGIRRFLRCMPYLTGQNVKFTITLETISGNPIEYSCAIKSYFLSGDRVAKQISHDERLISPITQKNRLQSELSIPFISLPGHYSIEFAFNYHNMIRFEPMAELYALSKDLLIARLFITSITLIIGGIIGWVLAHI